MSIKDGKKPLSQKPSQAKVRSIDTFGNMLAIPEDVQKDIEERGYIARWINAPKTAAQGGYNARGWEVYHRPKGVNDSISFGNNPDGVVRRGDCVLAVKSKEQHKMHKEYLEFEAEKKVRAKDRYAEDFKRAVRGHGLASKVYEGVDDDNN